MLQERLAQNHESFEALFTNPFVINFKSPSSLWADAYGLFLPLQDFSTLDILLSPRIIDLFVPYDSSLFFQNHFLGPYSICNKSEFPTRSISSCTEPTNLLDSSDTVFVPHVDSTATLTYNS